MVGLHDQHRNPMNVHYRLKTLTWLFLVALLLVGCTASSAYRKGRKAEDAKDYETAMAQYHIAAQDMPGNVDYQLKYQQARFAAAFMHFESGRRALEKRDLETAKAEFTKTLEIDPTHALARQELDRLTN